MPIDQNPDLQFIGNCLQDAQNAGLSREEASPICVDKPSEDDPNVVQTLADVYVKPFDRSQYLEFIQALPRSLRILEKSFSQDLRNIVKSQIQQTNNKAQTR